MKEDMEGLVLHGVYQHYKNLEHLYRIMGANRDSSTKEVLVKYKQLYEGEFPNRQEWSRPKKEFLENVVVDGKEIPRFKFVGMEMPNSKRKNRK